MTTALEAAERHIADLAANRVPAGGKPSAFHHGLIVSLVDELKRANSVLESAADLLAAEKQKRREDRREFERESRDIAAERSWQERQGDEYGSY